MRNESCIEVIFTTEIIVVFSQKKNFFLRILNSVNMEILDLVSDSDEEVLPKPNVDLSTKDDDDDDFDLKYPRLNLNDFNIVHQDKSKEKSATDTCKRVAAKNYSPPKRKKSESDSDYESQLGYCAPDTNNREINNIIFSDDDQEESEINKATGKGKKTATRSKKIDEEKQRKQEEKKRLQEEKKQLQEEKKQERLKKKEEAARLKAEKQLNAKNRLVVKADYSMKMMEIVIDDQIQGLDFFTHFLRNVEEAGTSYKAQSQLISKSITWNRTVEDNYINNQHEVCSSKRKVDENHVLVVWDYEETIRHMADDTFVSAVTNLKSLVPGKTLFLVIYKAETYFKFTKNTKNKAIQDDICGGLGEAKKRNQSKADRALASLPKVSRKKFEEFLLDIQLDLNVVYRLIENPDEMALLIHQYTRSLALLPSKLQKRQDASKIDWFVNSDSRDTVRVDKDGNGLKRLWQQQLCQFTLMSLESAEAICSQYKSPLQLMQAYADCTPAEGEVLLRDIPIRRAAGPITAVRRIGPELSKKVYVVFTSKEGNVYLNE